MHNNILLYALGFVAISGVSLHENNYISEIRIGRMCGSFAEQGQTSTIFESKSRKTGSQRRGKIAVKRMAFRKLTASEREN